MNGSYLCKNLGIKEMGGHILKGDILAIVYGY